MGSGFGKDDGRLAVPIGGPGVGLRGFVFLVSSFGIAKFRLHEIDQAADGGEVIGEDEQTWNEEDPAGHDGEDKAGDAEENQTDTEKEAAEML